MCKFFGTFRVTKCNFVLFYSLKAILSHKGTIISDSVYTLRSNGSPANMLLSTPSQKNDSERVYTEPLAERGYFRQRKAIKEKNQKKINKETTPPLTYRRGGDNKEIL